MENNSSSKRFKNRRTLHTRQKFKKSAGASDIKMKSTNSQISNSDEVEMESADLQILNSSEIEIDQPMLNSDEVEMEYADLQILNSSEIRIDQPMLNSDEVEMASGDLQILKSSEIETNRSLLNSDIVDCNQNNNNYVSEDDDIELQQILFYSAQFHSGKNLESISNNVADMEIEEMKHHVIYGSINLEDSTCEKGESSYTFWEFCEICENKFPLPNNLMQGTNCYHYYCVECIQNYVGKKINKDIYELIVKCPASNCDGILDLKSIMPSDYLSRVENAFQEIEALASSTVVDCPFMDCTGTLMDDKKGYPIRACPKCWRIFCIKCRDLHLGMTCEDYEYIRQLDPFYWQQFGGYQVEHQQEEEEEEETP